MKRTRGTSGQGGHTKLGQESDKSPRNEMRVLMFVTKASLKIDALFIQWPQGGIWIEGVQAEYDGFSDTSVFGKRADK